MSADDSISQEKEEERRGRRRRHSEGPAGLLLLQDQEDTVFRGKTYLLGRSRRFDMDLRLDLGLVPPFSFLAGVPHREMVSSSPKSGWIATASRLMRSALADAFSP